MGNLVCCTIERRNKSATPPVQTPAVNGNNGNHIESAQRNGAVQEQGDLNDEGKTKGTFC